jgi:hypothetical protein
LVQWLISFGYNIYFFFKHNDTELDTVFHNKSKTFKECYEKLEILEKELNEDLSSSKRILAKYEDNSKRTKRKFLHFSYLIEPSLVKIFLKAKKDENEELSVWKLLDKPIRFHYINICVALGLLIVAYSTFLFLHFGPIGILPLVLGLIFFLFLYLFVIRLNYLLLYLIIDGILIIFKQDRGRLSKNVILLGQLTNSGQNSGYVVSSSGYSSYGGFSSGGFDAGGFGGFGGGSFGGGGAGGSW